MNTTNHTAIAAAQDQMDATIAVPLTGEEVAAAAYAQFGIVADDAEIVAFAAWVLEQAAQGRLLQHTNYLLSQVGQPRRPLVDLADAWDFAEPVTIIEFKTHHPGAPA